MMELTRKGEYAIRGIIYLAKKRVGEISLLSEIAEGTEVPPMFLAKIFQNFAKIGLISSFRGSGGGFTLNRDPSTITLREIVEAVEGPIIPNRCLLNDKGCNRAATCTVHPVWRRVQEQVSAILDGVSLADLARDR
ncbi:MAG: Rrf2 family transcriptional regulator [Desulfuromonadia bacterium]